MRALAVGAALVALVAACGDDDDAAETGAAPSTAALETAGEAVAVSLEDFTFSPSTIDVGAAGNRVTVSLRNDGAVAHTFTVAGADVDEELAPGETAEVDVDVPADGLTFACRFHGSGGMTGAFVVEGAAPPGSSTTVVVDIPGGFGY